MRGVMERAGAWSRMRRNSKMGVTQAEAGGRPVDSKWVLPKLRRAEGPLTQNGCYPTTPLHGRTKQAAGTTPAGLPRSRFLGCLFPIFFPLCRASGW
jgi:hypothetical protein